MENIIKTRKIVHDIKTKDTNGHLTHFIKDADIQITPHDIGSKEETSAETRSANNVQGTLKKTSVTAFDQTKTYTKNKIKAKRDNVKILKESIVVDDPIHYSSPVSHSFKEKKYVKQMRQLNIAKHKRKVKEAKEAKTAAVIVKDTGIKVIRTTFIAVKKAVTAFPSLALAGLGLILLLVIALFIGVFSAFSSSSLILPGTASLSEEVLAHTETIEKYAENMRLKTMLPYYRPL